MLSYHFPFLAEQRVKFYDLPGYPDPHPHLKKMRKIMVRRVLGSSDIIAHVFMARGVDSSDLKHLWKCGAFSANDVHQQPPLIIPLLNAQCKLVEELPFITSPDLLLDLRAKISKAFGIPVDMLRVPHAKRLW